MADSLDDLLALFAPLARQAKARPICWITDGGDAATDFCHDCARHKARHLRRHGHKAAFADGGWDLCRESDVTSFCGGCGCLLGYSLSEYAFGEELEHWKSDALVEVITPIHAYELLQLVEGARSYGTPEDIAETIAVVSELSRLISPSSGPIPHGKRDGGGA